MHIRIALVIGLFASLSLAAKPSTQPVASRKPTSRPIASATTRPADSPRSSFAKEMIAKFQESKKKDQQKLKVAYIDLDREVVERSADIVLFADPNITLHNLLRRIKEARDDKDARAVLINFGETDFNLSQAQEIRDALVDLRKVNKRSFVYSDSYDTAAYIAATGASDICMLSGGEIMMPGVGLEAMFAKGLLDKVGVKADYVQIGQYKGADEQFTRTEPSKEMRGELNKVLDSLFQQIVDSVAYHRNITSNDVKDAINGVMMNGKAAKQRKLIDHLVDQDGLRDLLKKELGRDVDLLHDYGKPEAEVPDFSNPLALFSSLMKKGSAEERETDKPEIALIYLHGVIVDGDSDGGILGPPSQIGSENLRKALRIAARDENVKAIVLRIDSPGGSAMASEVMWQAARRAAGEKPLIISVGSMAASGGYYVASAGQYIFADPTAIVGSIGVVGGKFVLKDLFEKIGLHTEAFTRGANADLFSMNQPFTDPQRRLVTNWMQQTYDQFVERVMSTRKDKIKDIDDVAHGRIFVAKQARQLGMVDEIGGMEKALAYAAEKAKLTSGDYEVRQIPAQRTLADLLRGHDPDAIMPFFRSRSPLAADSILRTLSPRNARLLMQQVQMLRLLQQRPVALVSPYVVTIK